jgi:hypothetical protein
MALAGSLFYFLPRENNIFPVAEDVVLYHISDFSLPNILCYFYVPFFSKMYNTSD